MKEISVIGATSPLGVRLVDRLAQRDYKVHATYRSAERVPAHWQPHPRVIASRFEISEPCDFHDVWADCVIWLVHINQGRFNEDEPRANLKPFLQFLHETRGTKVEKVIFVSSGGSVYGEARNLPIAEHHPRDPLSSYGMAKKAMEDALIEFGREAETRTAIIRPGNIYGFNSPCEKGIVGAFLASILKQTPFTLIDKGRTVRDFIHVDDVCRAIDHAISSDRPDILWNAGTGVGTSVSDLLGLITSLGGFGMPAIKNVENYASDVKANILNIDRIGVEAGWAPETDLQNGIAKAVSDWHRLDGSGALTKDYDAAN